MPDLPQALAALRKDWSLDFNRVERVLATLADGGSVSQLVAASGLPRRDVELVLHELSPWLKPDGDQHLLSGPTPLHTSRPDETALTERMARLAAGLPPSRWRLDHVPATAETMARRALYLAGEYELDGASVLCLGDHDLTSLAVGSVAPGADLTVVDIDEPILDHVAESSERLGFPVTTAWADLRLALPPSLIGTADLVFTDPPYTTDGMRLFLVRALEALRRSGHERVAFCFGTGERHLVKALEVQSLLGDLRLALEAMLPGFNHYTGAEAIGARSDLYICRPTNGARVGEAARPGPPTRAARKARAARLGGPSDARIYTRGPAAREATDRGLPEPVISAALTAARRLTAAGDGRLTEAGDGPLGAAGEGAFLLVGDGWGNAAIGLPEFFARVAAWVTAARPGPFPFAGTPVINTHPDFGSAALRTLLLTAPERAVLVAPRRDLTAGGLLSPGPEPDPLARLLASAYDWSPVPTGPGGDPAVISVLRHDRAPAGAADAAAATDAVLRHIVLHPGAKLVNAWRDALLAAARDAGESLTKNEARARIPTDSLSPNLRRLRLWELPLATLRTLPDEVPQSVPG